MSIYLFIYLFIAQLNAKEQNPSFDLIFIEFST